MIANTTKLNTPGAKLANLAGVHALTDVTGFGLLGHLLEAVPRRETRAEVSMAQVPLLPGVEALANRDSSPALPVATGPATQGRGARRVNDVKKMLLTDPQTSGGLLVACSPDAVDAVLSIFRAEGFEHAARSDAWQRASPKCAWWAEAA